MTRTSAKEVLPYEPEIEKQLRQPRKERNLTEMLEKVGQSSTKEIMTGNSEDNVDVAAREAAERRDQVARDAEEASIRDAQIIYEEEKCRRIAQNQPFAVDQFGNIAPGPGRLLGDYARPVYNQGLSSVRPPPIATNNFELKQGLELLCLQRESKRRSKYTSNGLRGDYEHLSMQWCVTRCSVLKGIPGFT